MMGNAIFGLRHSVCPEPVTYAVLDTAKIGGKVRGFLHIAISPELETRRFLGGFLASTDDNNRRLLIRRQAAQQSQDGSSGRGMFKSKRIRAGVGTFIKGGPDAETPGPPFRWIPSTRGSAGYNQQWPA